MRIEELNFSVRTYNVLARAGIVTVEELCGKTAEEVKKIRNMGGRSFNEIVTALASKGMRLAEVEE